MDNMGQAFDSAARDFDALAPYLWSPIGQATVAQSAPQTGEHVLDACCGDGASAVPAALRVGRAGRVDAVDLSATMIALARRRAKGLPQFHAHTADAAVWGGSGYDVVQCVLGVFFLPDMNDGAAHLVARARPGGRVAMTIWRQGAMEIPGKSIGAAREAVTGVRNPPQPAHPISGITEKDTFATWLTGLGLDDVTVREHPLTLPLTDDLAWLVITGSGFMAALQGLSPAQVDQVRVEYLTSLRHAAVTGLDATTLIGVGTRKM